MKNRILAALLAVCASACLNGAYAQKYEPRDSWPYLFEEFTAGSIYANSASKPQKAEVNISVLEGKLHYVEGETIMEAKMATSVTVGDRKFINIYGKMMEVLAEDENGSVVRSVLLDKDELGKTDIGYGISSATASSMDVTTLLGDGASDMVNMNMYTASEKKGEGVIIPVRESLHIWYGTTLVLAAKSEVMQTPGLDKAAAKAFFKSNSIKWKDPQSLLLVLDFLAGQK